MHHTVEVQGDLRCISWNSPCSAGHRSTLAWCRCPAGCCKYRNSSKPVEFIQEDVSDYSTLFVCVSVLKRERDTETALVSYLELDGDFEHWASDGEDIADDDEDVPAVNEFHPIRPTHLLPIMLQKESGVLLEITHTQERKRGRER